MTSLHAFADNLASLLKTGTPLYEALILIGRHHPDSTFRAALEKISQDVESGLSLSEALANQKPVFSPFFIGMVQSGEASKTLAESLKTVAQQLQREENLRQKIKSALIYPAILTVGMFVSLVIIFSVVVPQFAALFDQYGTETTSLSRTLMWFGHATQAAAPWLLMAIVIFVVWFFKFSNKDAVRQSAMGFLQRTSVLKDLTNQLDYARFCHSLSSLLESGQPQTDALKLACQSFSTTTNQSQISNLIERIEAGETLGQCLTDLDGLDPLYAHSLANAERSSEFTFALSEVGNRLENDFNMRCIRLAQLIEPILIIVLGTVIGLIVYALFSSLQNISGAAL